MSKVRLRLITLQAAQADTAELSLFVMNRTKPAGNINMTVTGDDGISQTVVIPTTFIPVDMSNFVSKAALLRSTVFRRLVASGSVVLVDPNNARDAIENDPRAAREAKRLVSINAAVNSTDGPGVIEMDYSGVVSEEKRSQATAGDEEDAGQQINPFAIGIVSRANSGDDIADLICDLESHAHTLEIVDFDYIMTNVSDQTLKSWVDTYLSEQQDA